MSDSRHHAAYLGFCIGLGFVLALLAGCYAHTPTPSCSANPNQPQCLPPIHDERPR